MAEANASLAQAESVSAANPHHLVCQIDGRKQEQAEAAAAFRSLAQRVNAAIKLEIILPAQEPAEVETERIANVVHEVGLRPESIVITQAHDLKSFQPGTPRPWGPGYEDMAKAARQFFPGTLIGGGMLSYFTELNRKPPPQGVFDFITHTVCPIVHAADDISVMETLEALPSIFASTRKMIGNARYHIGPSGISARDNPYGAAVTPNPENRRLCLSDRDPRQRGQFAAAWNLGLVAAAAKGRIDAIALGAATGPQGVIAADGTRYAAYSVLAGLCPLSGAKLIDAQSSAPRKVIALCCEHMGGRSVWLANLTSDKLTVTVKGMKLSRVELDAYAVVSRCLDSQ
jgi:D-apionolactonase